MHNSVKWPTQLLRPATAMASPVSFSRTGGRSLGGVERTSRTDRGFWRITLSDVTILRADMRRTWNAIRTSLGGKAGLVVVPAWSFDSTPYLSGRREARLLSLHDDDASFDDDTPYEQGSVIIEMAAFAPLGATVVSLRLIQASGAVGVRFSYQDALYETGPILGQPEETVFQVSVFPSVRAPIPAGATLEVDDPTCLCHLADDRGMDLGLNNTEVDTASVEFIEAVDYWNDLALGLVA